MPVELTGALRLLPPEDGGSPGFLRIRHVFLEIDGRVIGPCRADLGGRQLIAGEIAKGTIQVPLVVGAPTAPDWSRSPGREVGVLVGGEVIGLFRVGSVRDLGTTRRERTGAPASPGWRLRVVALAAAAVACLAFGLQMVANAPAADRPGLRWLFGAGLAAGLGAGLLDRWVGRSRSTGGSGTPSFLVVAIGVAVGGAMARAPVTVQELFLGLGTGVFSYVQWRVLRGWWGVRDKRASRPELGGGSDQEA
jgi:hypothetical protein